jgi:mRNA interferase RelE/StbE
MSLKRNLKVPDEITALIRGLHPDLKKKVRFGLDQILQDPTVGKTLREELEGLWSLRIGRFRVIYRIDTPQIIEVVAIGPRKTIYEETLRLIKRDSYEVSEED